MAKEILFRTADGLTCIEKTDADNLAPRIMRSVKKRISAGSAFYAVISDNYVPSAREYEYRGRLAELYVYEEVVTE